MTSITFFFIFVPILAIILLAVNLIFAPHSPYQEKDSAFECGFHSFLGQNRTQFSISFFIFALLFLLPSNFRSTWGNSADFATKVAACNASTLLRA